MQFKPSNTDECVINEMHFGEREVGDGKDRLFRYDKCSVPK